MSFKIIAGAQFERELKKLSKKHFSLKSDLQTLLVQLLADPQTGTPIGNSCFKIRLAIASKKKGKSGGARVITYVKIVNETVYLVSIYDKSETDSISDKEILARISEFL